MRINKLNRFVQEPRQCAIAACACVGNFYNRAINYKNTKAAAVRISGSVAKAEGLETAEVGLLLNSLGFRRVTVISTDLEYLDYSWAKLSQAGLIDKLHVVARKTSHLRQDTCKMVIGFLQNESCHNRLIIDYHFGEHIRNMLSQRQPLLISFNWSLFFKFPKVKGLHFDPVFGDPEYHIVVAYGFDDKGVFVIDSHEQFYKYRLKKFRKGRYLIPWEELMLVMSGSDMIIPEDYSLENASSELV